MELTDIEKKIIEAFREGNHDYVSLDINRIDQNFLTIAYHGQSFDKTGKVVDEKRTASMSESPSFHVVDK